MMATITLDTPLKLKKTHFKDPVEAAHFLLGLQLKGHTKKSQDKSTMVHPSNQKAYQNRNVEDYFTLEQMKSKYGIQD